MRTALPHAPTFPRPGCLCHGREPVASESPVRRWKRAPGIPCDPVGGHRTTEFRRKMVPFPLGESTSAEIVDAAMLLAQTPAVPAGGLGEATVGLCHSHRHLIRNSPGIQRRLRGTGGISQSDRLRTWLKRLRQREGPDAILARLPARAAFIRSRRAR